MSEAIEGAPVESAGDVTTDQSIETSTEASGEVGSGEVAAEVTDESGLAQELDGEQLDQLADEVQDAVAEGATDEEVQELIETFKLKVNGKEKEVTLDWNNKEDIIRRLQMAEAGQSAMQKASEYEKNYEYAMKQMLDNPWETLKELGYDPDEMAELRIQQKIEELQKSPEQLEREARDRELEELRQKLQEQEEERERIEFERLQAQAEVDLDNQITEALSSTSELPKSPYVVKRIADAMLTAIESGREDVTVKDVIPWVEKEINSELQDLFSAMPDKVLEHYLGQKTMERLRKNRLAKMQTQTQPVKNIAETGKQAPIENALPKKKVKLTDWLRHGSSLSDFE